MPFLGDFGILHGFLLILKFRRPEKSNAETIFLLLIIFCPSTFNLNGYVQRKLSVIITIYCVRPKIVKRCFQSTQNFLNQFSTRALKNRALKKISIFFLLPFRNNLFSWYIWVSIARNVNSKKFQAQTEDTLHLS